MPYNKGDFTQQGIDGKVSGGLLLNNKRDVDVLVSTNEDDSTLDLIAVTVEDHLNSLKYAFWGENLEAGEVYEIGAGGGIANPILTLEIKNTTGSTDGIMAKFLVDNEIKEIQLDLLPNSDETYEIIIVPASFDNGETFVYDFLTYPNGTATFSNLVNCTTLESPDIGLSLTDPTQNASATLTIS